MKDLDIRVGDRVTYIETRIVICEDREEMGDILPRFYLKTKEVKNEATAIVTNSNIDFKEVVKVERIGQKGWYTVYEKDPEILDKKEKEYLSAVIKPFKNRINKIVKMPNYDDLEKEFISINFIDNDDDLDFPLFKKDTMYKNMKSKKSYTLKELGLE